MYFPSLWQNPSTMGSTDRPWIIGVKLIRGVAQARTPCATVERPPVKDVGGSRGGRRLEWTIRSPLARRLRVSSLPNISITLLSLGRICLTKGVLSCITALCRPAFPSTHHSTHRDPLKLNPIQMYKIPKRQNVKISVKSYRALFLLLHILDWKYYPVC